MVSFGKDMSIRILFTVFTYSSRFITTCNRSVTSWVKYIYLRSQTIHSSIVVDLHLKCILISVCQNILNNAVGSHNDRLELL